MHEQSETIQRKDGRWVNVYGRDLPQAGRQLPGTMDYGTMEEAVSAAKARSKSFDVTPDAAMAELEARAASGQLNPRAQEALAELKRRKGLTTPAPDAPPQPPQQDESAFRPVGVAATGFNKGLAGWVDLINDGMKAIGLPMADEPFMGTAFVDKHLAGAQFKPQNFFEAALQRAGLEVGANAPILGGTLAVQAGANAAKAADAVKPVMASTNLEAFKNLPKVFVEELTKIAPTKLAAIESALAAGAGTGAEIVKDIFPEGGATSEFVGELLGSFAPSFVMNLVGKAQQGAAGLARVALGLESKEETQRRLGQKLGEAAKPEQIQEGVDRAEALRKEVSPDAKEGEGLQLSAGSAITGGEVTSVEKAEAKASVKIGAKLKDQREQNLQELERYFNETEPPGDPAVLVDTLQRQREKSDALLKLGLDRTEMRLAAARGELSKRQAAFMADLETRMQNADRLLDARLKAIGPQLTPKQRQDVIRAAYDDEVAKFRATSQADYRELDNLGTAELPVDNTISKLASLQDRETGWPDQLEAIRKIKPGIAKAIDNLGRNYELMRRAEKATADLEAVGGKGLDQRGGFRLPLETQGTGSTGEVVGIKSNYPFWYKELTKKKQAGSDLTIDRETVEKALDTFKTGAKHGLHQDTLNEVEKALMSDAEFRKSPFHEPVMDELNRTPSAALKDLRHLRSDLLQLSREARSRNDRLQNYITQELISAVDADIDRLVPGTSAYADLYPQHGSLYRQISADYRDGVQRLYKGQAGKLGQVARDGSYRVDEGGVPDLFWKDQTSLESFTKAFGSQADAKIALRDHALNDLYHTTVKPIGNGKFAIDEIALEKWLTKHRPQLAAFPDLEPQFRNAVELQKNFDAVKDEMTLVSRARSGEDEINRRLTTAARPGDFTPQRVSEAEARLNRVQDVVERTRTQWESQKASLFLDKPVQTAANAVIARGGEEALKAYQSVARQVKGDPEALAGLNKAVWMAIRDKYSTKLVGMTGQPNLGAWHKMLSDMLETYGPVMKEALGPDGIKRIEVAREVIQKVATGSKAGSDTAINLQLHAALASSWLSRAWATVSGRVPAGFGFAERAMQGMLKLIEKQTVAQQEEILLQAFHDPKMFQTLVNAAQYGPQNRMVQTQYQRHLHLLNMSEQMSERPEPAQDMKEASKPDDRAVYKR